MNVSFHTSANYSYYTVKCTFGDKTGDTRWHKNEVNISTTCLQSIGVTHKPFISLHHYQHRAATLLWKKPSPWLPLIIISTSLHPLTSKVQTGTKCSIKMGYLSEHPVSLFSPSCFPTFCSSYNFPAVVRGVVACKILPSCSSNGQHDNIVRCYLKEAHKNQWLQSGTLLPGLLLDTHLTSETHSVIKEWQIFQKAWKTVLFLSSSWLLTC